MSALPSSTPKSYVADDQFRLIASPAPWGVAVPLVAIVAGIFSGSIGHQLVASAQGLDAGERSLASTAAGVVAMWLAAGVVLFVALRQLTCSAAGVLGLRASAACSFSSAKAKWLIGAAMAGVVCQFVAVPILYAPLRLFDSDRVNRLDDSAREVTALADNAWGIVALGVLLVVGAPLVEEIIYRAVLVGALRRRLSVRGSVVIGGLIFGAIHIQPLQFPALALFGMLLGVIAYRSGSLWPAVACHMGFNMATLVVLTLG
jgi:membrane protease YdiL (CAAX protease family)